MFVTVSQEQILSDLAESRQQIFDGKGLDMENATVYVDAIYHQLQDSENTFADELNE